MTTVARRGATTKTAGPLIVATISAVGVAALYVIAVRTSAGQEFDELARESRKLTDLGVRRAGVSLMRIAVVTALPLAFLASLVKLAIDRRRRVLVSCAIATAVAIATAEALKAGLPRPPIAHLQWIATQATYPSGHAAYAMAVALTAVAAASRTHRGLVPWIGAAIAWWALVLAGSGWHRPSDVVAGFLTASTCFAVARRFNRSMDLESDEDATGPRVAGPTRLRRSAVAVGAVLLLVFYLPLGTGPVGFDLNLSVYVLCSLLTIITGVGTVMLHARLSRPTRGCRAE